MSCHLSYKQKLVPRRLPKTPNNSSRTWYPKGIRNNTQRGHRICRQQKHSGFKWRLSAELRWRGWLTLFLLYSGSYCCSQPCRRVKFNTKISSLCFFMPLKVGTIFYFSASDTAYKGQSWKGHCSANRDKCFLAKSLHWNAGNEQIKYKKLLAHTLQMQKHACQTLHFQQKKSILREC